MEHTEHVETTQKPLSIDKRIILNVAPPSTTVLLKALLATSKLEVRGREHLDNLVATHGRVIIAFWHEVLGLAAWYHRNSGLHTMTSQSFDGELAARFAKHLGLHVVRGSSTRGGAVAMSQLKEAMEAGPGFGLSVDGPRGPRRVAKPGVAYFSARTGVPVLPNAFLAEPAWRLNSWDRLVIPRPFSRIVCAFGPVVPPAADRSREALEDARQKIEDSINALHAELGDEI